MESSAASSSSDAGRLCVGEYPTHSRPSRAPRVTLRAWCLRCCPAAMADAGGCGFFGSSQLGFYCSVCFKKTHGEEEFNLRLQADRTKKDHASAAVADKAAVAEAMQPPDCIDATCTAGDGIAGQEIPAVGGRDDTDSGAQDTAASAHPGQQAEPAAAGGEASKESVEPALKKIAPSRCMSCNKKIGLLGFHCRCGGTFCEKHRYSDMHECKFDYKTHGKEQVCCKAYFRRHSAKSM